MSYKNLMFACVYSIYFYVEMNTYMRMKNVYTPNEV